MQNIKLILEYDGTRYRGFEHIKSRETISTKLLDAIHRITGEEVQLFAAVKTEPGIHALAQTVSFLLSRPANLQNLKRQLNKTLPADIAILDAETAPERFHAALNLASCTYLCRIDTSGIPNIFTSNTTLHVPHSLDIQAMDTAASCLCGTHDFTFFSDGKTKKSCIRSITELSLASSSSGSQLNIRITANSFLRKMPQYLTSVLLETGLGRLNACDVPRIFSGEIACPSPCPPKGLCLIEANYL